MNGAVSSFAINEDEDSLSARAAWLHFVGGLTQGEVAVRLNVPNGKAHRLIARANRAGLVQVFINGEIGACLRLEERLKQRFGRSICQVAPALDADPLPCGHSECWAPASSGSPEAGLESVIGLGYGRTLAACINQLPYTNAGTTRFVSLLGGFSESV